MRLKVFYVAKNLLDVMFAMTKVHCTRLLDIEICSVTVLNMYIECYSLLSIVIPSRLFYSLPSIIF